jgi:hypothetical protein
LETVTIFFGAVASILAYITKAKWKELSTIGKSSLIIGIIAVIFGAILAHTKAKKEALIERIEATYGTIGDTFGATFPDIMIGYRSSAPLEKQFGGVFRIFQIEWFKAYVKNDKLFVNIVIRDSMGEPIIAILENEWTKYQNTYEFNNDETALELVKKGDRSVFFHLELKEGILHVEGILYHAARVGIQLIDSGTGDNWSQAVVVAHGEGDYNNSQIQRLFKYPRERYLGVREKAQ